MKYIMKRLVALVVSGFVVFYSTFDVQAGDTLTQVQISTEEAILLTAEEWGETIYPELDIEVKNIQEIVVLDSEEVEYTVDYFVNGTPYGYAVVCFKDNTPTVKEGCINEGTEGLYEELVDVTIEKVSDDVEEVRISKSIVELSPLQYGVVAEVDDEVVAYDNYGNIHTGLPKESKVYSSYNSYLISEAEWASGYKEDTSNKVISQKYIDGNKFLFCSEDAKANAGRYACVVQALYNISYMEGIVGRGAKLMQKEYVNIWEYTNTEETTASKKDSDEDYIYGATDMYDASVGYIKYVKSKGYTRSSYGMVSDPSASWFKNNLKSNRSILLGYDVKFKDEDGETVEVGHAVAVLGYIKATKTSSGNTYDYLMIADGWGKDAMYINYSVVDFTGVSATYFTIK